MIALASVPVLDFKFDLNQTLSWKFFCLLFIAGFLDATFAQTFSKIG